MRELYQKHRILYVWYVLFLSGIVSCALGLKLGAVGSSDTSVSNPMMAFLINLKSSFPDNGINNFLLLLLILVALFLLVRKSYSVRCKVYSIVFSTLCASLVLVARSYYKVGSIELLFGSGFYLFKALLVLWGYAILIYNIVNLIFEYGLPKLANSQLVRTIQLKRFKITFWSCLLALLLAWLPYVIVCYPANFCRDARDEIAQFIGDESMSSTAKTVIYPEGSKTLLNNHHPVAYTLLVGSFAKIGFSIGHINIGIFLFVLFQMFILACIYSYTITYIKSLDVPLIFQYCALGFFMFFPVIPMYAITVTKDSLFGGFLILVSIGVFKLIHSEDSIMSSWKEKLGMMFSCIGLTAFRNNGIYILFILLFVLLIYYRKSFKKIGNILLMVGIPVFFYWIIILKVVFPMAGIPGGSPREMLSIPFQQIARYAVEWGEDGFEDDEIETIDKILCFDGDISILQKRYNPELADGVKNRFNKNHTKEELSDFINVWFKLLKRHPGTFIEATLNNIYDLFSFDNNKRLVYSGVPEKGNFYGLSSPKQITGIRKNVVQAINTMGKSSMFGWAFSLGAWDFMFILCILYTMYKRQFKYIIVALPVVVNILICIAGPVSYMRYAIEWIVVFPVFAAMVWCCLESNKTENQRLIK